MRRLMFIFFILLFVAAASAYDSELDNLWLTGWLNVTENVTIRSDLNVTGNVTASYLDTGQGANELYAMNQDVESTNDVQFQNITLSGNLTISQDNKFCYNAACTAYSYFNGTCLWHVGLTSVDIIC